MSEEQAESLESYWAVLRRTQFEDESPVTINAAVAIERVLTAMLDLVPLLQRERPSVKADEIELRFRPKRRFKNEDDKEGEVVYEVYLACPGFEPHQWGVACFSIEVAIEQAVFRLRTAIDARRKTATRKAEQLAEAEQEQLNLVHDFRSILVDLGEYNRNQPNLPGLSNEVVE